VYRQRTHGGLNTISGSHRLELLDDEGDVLAEYAFATYEIPEAPGFSSFGMYVPAIENLDGMRVRAGEKVLADVRGQGAHLSVDLERKPVLEDRADQGRVLRWSPAVSAAGPVVYLVRISKDGGHTWQVLALDKAEPQIFLPEQIGVDLSNVWVEIQASDGLRTTTQIFQLAELR
jgi:hypothetical protein